jgi:hypothetical protein
MDLTTATPIEIDTDLVKAYRRIADLTSQQHRINATVSRIDEVEPGSYQSMLPGNSAEIRAKLVGEIEALQERIQKILQSDVYPREAQYRDRRWTRYYLVDNTNGHVHKDQDCTTCFPTTQYVWLFEQSGLSAKDLVDLAGKQACTTCFPWAPVDVLKRKSRLEAPERKAARLEREAKKAAAAAKKAAKAIANPDGTPLEVFDWRVPERHYAQRGGGVKVVEAHDTYKTLETAHAARGWLADQFEGWRNDGTHRDIKKVAEAVAHKEGKDVETVLAEAKQRAAKRK